MSEILRGHGIEVLETAMGDLVDVAKYDELRKRLSDAALVEAELREELANARKDAERGRYCVKHGGWYRNDEDRITQMMVIVPYGLDLSCVAMRENAIDAAIAQEGK